MIAIVDYGVGNLGSVANMFRKVGAKDVTITSDPAALRAARGLVLPGVGHFDSGVRHLRERNLVEVLNECVLERRTPVLGICLGMQLLARRSEEGSEPGLGWIAADVVRFPDRGAELPVPHMGWNEVTPVDEVLFSGLPPGDSRFYFVHSFYIRCDDERDVAGWTRYGDRFASSVRAGHVFGTQFHPEKSHRFGMKVLSNFHAFVQAQ